MTICDPGALSRLVAMRALFGQGAYGHPAAGTATTLRAITREDVVAAYREAWAPRNATLILTGDIDPAAARALAERHFGSWSAELPAAPRPAPAAAGARRPGEVIVIDFPEGQAAVGRPDGPGRDPILSRAARHCVLSAVQRAAQPGDRIRRASLMAPAGIDARRLGGAFVANTQRATRRRRLLG